MEGMPEYHLLAEQTGLRPKYDACHTWAFYVEIMERIKWIGV